MTTGGDPRPWFAALLGAYLVCGLVFLGFARTPWQAAMVVITAALADFLTNRFFRKRTEFPWSGLITGCGLALLLDYGSNTWLPLLPPLLAIGSKHLFTLNGKHVYNPALFGVIAGMLLGGGLISPAPAYQWGGTWAVALFLAGLAMVVFIRKIQRGWLVGSFLVFYCAQTALRAWVMRHHVPAEAIWLGTLTAPAFFLFVFYMLTDPATSPAKKGAQVGIAAAITMADLAFHFMQGYYTLFYAAFAVQTARFLWAWARSRSFPDTRVLIRKTALAMVLLGVAFALDRSPRGLTESPGFRWVERDVFPSEQGTILTDIDPRLQHVGKWTLSVGDAAAVADVDGDGLQDLFLTRPMKRTEYRCALFRNTGNLTFERVPLPALDAIRADPAEYGLPSCAVFADIDNDGDGTFVKVDICKLGMPETHWTLALNSADFDGDGWPDIYAASDFGPDDLYLNEKGKGFRRVEGSHFGSVGKDTYKGMNVSIADFDRSGTPDIHVSNVHAPLQAEGSLLWMTERKNGTVRFHNEAAKRGALNPESFGWGGASQTSISTAGRTWCRRTGWWMTAWTAASTSRAITGM